MSFNASLAIKSSLAALGTASVLVAPAAASATAAPAPAPFAAAKATNVSAESIDAICRKHSRTYVVKKYYRGPAIYTLRCGTKTWGWRHIKLRHGWNNTMDRKIGAAIWSGQPNGRGGFSTYTATCPVREKFRTIMGTPAGRQDLLTAYNVTTTAAANC